LGFVHIHYVLLRQMELGLQTGAVGLGLVQRECLMNDDDDDDDEVTLEEEEQKKKQNKQTFGKKTPSDHQIFSSTFSLPFLIPTIFSTHKSSQSPHQTPQ